MTTSTILGFVGDLLIDREKPEDIFSKVTGLLHEPDILFGNLESVYADNPPQTLNPLSSIAPSIKNLEAYGPAGFKVISLANNHTIDAGHETLLDNMQRLNKMGIKTCGAGKNLSQAREPAILEVNGLKVAYLANSSIFPMGFEAHSTRPGVAPLRAYNHYHELVPGFHFPGVPPRIETIPDRDDLENLRADIQSARSRADIVIVSCHWGDFMKPFHLTDHETRTARFCIDHGADMVVGHHHHALRGMEWYSGKPIMYGLGHFFWDAMLVLTDDMKKFIPPNDSPDFYGIAPREGWPLLPMHPDTRLTVLAWAKIEDRRISAIGFVPCRLRPNGQVEAVSPDSVEGSEVVEYLRKCCVKQNLNARILPENSLTLGNLPTMRIAPAS